MTETSTILIRRFSELILLCVFAAWRLCVRFIEKTSRVGCGRFQRKDAETLGRKGFGIKSSLRLCGLATLRSIH